MSPWVILAAWAVAAGLSFFATPVTRRLAVRLGAVDVPGRHKAHGRAVPLLGGSAIFFAVLMPAMLALALVQLAGSAGGAAPWWLPEGLLPHVPGAVARTPLAMALLAGAAVLHVMGLVDDVRPLGPWAKLLVELAVAVGVVLLAGRVRVLTALGEPASAVLTVLWIVLITNAFNFLDNMDGLSAGVAAICCGALLGTSLRLDQFFVPAALALLLGALVGFLPYNFHPARSFMGDAGSLVIGYLLATLSCLTTYVPAGEPFYRYGVFLPLVLLAVPLYDTASVILLRVRDRQNPMVGDRRHFSHRLIRRGMGVRTAVLTIYLCTAVTALSAVLLPRVGDTGAMLVFVQTVLVLLMVALLETGNGKR